MVVAARFYDCNCYSGFLEEIAPICVLKLIKQIRFYKLVATKKTIMQESNLINKPFLRVWSFVI